MFRYEVLDLGPGCQFEEVSVGHDDFVEGLAIVVGVALQSPLGGGFAAVGRDGSLGEHIAKIQKGVGLAALGTAVQTDDSHGMFGIRVIGSRCARRRVGCHAGGHGTTDMALLSGHYSPP